MSNIPCNSDDLALVDHYITQTRRLIDEQQGYVRHRATDGHDTAQAEETLREIQKTLRCLRAFRELLDGLDVRLPFRLVANVREHVEQLLGRMVEMRGIEFRQHSRVTVTRP